jgi:hypothetical protein
MQNIRKRGQGARWTVVPEGGAGGGGEEEEEAANTTSEMLYALTATACSKV